MKIFSVDNEMTILIQALQDLVRNLTSLGGLIQLSGGSSLRVVGVSMPSTAVTGPLTNAQYIATPLVGAVHYTQRTAMENTAAVLSNINNCTGA